MLTVYVEGIGWDNVTDDQLMSAQHCAYCKTNDCDLQHAERLPLEHTRCGRRKEGEETAVRSAAATMATLTAVEC